MLDNRKFLYSQINASYSNAMLGKKIYLELNNFFNFSALKTTNSFFSFSPYERPCRLQDYNEGVFNETEGEVSNIHSHNANELFFCLEGSLEFVQSPYKKFILNAGEALIIPKSCIHGTKILSKVCKYGSLCIE